jgi:prepilin-type processing-associated H-X9-DG protein
VHSDADEKHQFQFSYGFSGAYDSPIDALDKDKRRSIRLTDLGPSAADLGAIVDIDETTHTEVIQRAYQIHARHDAKLNMGYLDGHVERRSALIFFSNDVQWDYLGYNQNGSGGVKTGGITGTSGWMDKGDPVIQ